LPLPEVETRARGRRQEWRAKVKILAEIETARQKVTLARKGRHVGLLINDCLQFHSGDQAPLHELLVTLPLCLHRRPQRVLVLGGGIGLTAREALRFSELERLVLVEIDSQLYELSRTHPVMRDLHQDAFSDPRVEVVLGDAFAFVKDTRERFDLIVNAVDVTYTPQDQEISADAILRLWRAERGLLRDEGWLVTYVNDVELAQFFDGSIKRARHELPTALAEDMAGSLSVYYQGAFAGDHVFAAATFDPQPIELRRPVPPGCVYLDDRLVRRFLKRGYLPGHWQALI
jgi:spermidine synthase